MVRQTAAIAIAALSTLSQAQISDNFENGWNQTLWPIYAPDCNQGGSVTLDSTVAHSGTHSMKVVGGPNGYCGHIFFGTTDVPSGDVYVRVWVKPETALNDDHITFIDMPDPGLGTDKHLRFGGMDEIMIYNRESDDATLPSLSPDGIATSVGLSTTGFQCLEYYLGSNGTIETWLNGDAIAGLEAGPGIDNPNASNWESGDYKPAITGVYFGWEAYSGDINTMWYDDISISSTRVGCGDTGSTGGNGGGNGGGSTTTSSAGSTGGFTTSTTTTTTAPATTTTSSSGPTQTKWGQCGGQGWTGPTTCVAGTTCTKQNDYYSQCL